jgi:hypothetical protein
MWVRTHPTGLPGEAPVEPANEYASAQDARVCARNHVRLEIVAAQLGRGIRLCPPELESPARQPHGTLSTYLQMPSWPEDQ